jgi:hypothetical protein
VAVAQPARRRFYVARSKAGPRILILLLLALIIILIAVIVFRPALMVPGRGRTDAGFWKASSWRTLQELVGSHSCGTFEATPPPQLSFSERSSRSSLRRIRLSNSWGIALRLPNIQEQP